MLSEDLEFDNLIPSFFHIADRYCDLSWCVPPESRNFHNFMLVVSGEGTSLTDGCEYEMKPGMLIYHHPGQSFGFTTSKKNLMHCFGVNFYISTTICDSGIWSLNNVERLPIVNFLQISNMDILIKYFKDLANVWEEEIRNKNLKCRSIFSNILYELANQILQKQNNSLVLQKIEIVTTYIRKHFNYHLTLEFLSELIGLNPSYFSFFFKKYSGHSLVEYINFIRVEKASEYLQIGYSVALVAEKVGFNDPFYFSKVFKKYKGVCPKTYSQAPSHFC